MFVDFHKKNITFLNIFTQNTPHVTTKIIVQIYNQNFEGSFFTILFVPHMCSGIVRRLRLLSP